MIQNRNHSNSNYINNKKLNLHQMLNINQRKEYQINQPNIKTNMGLNVKNQRNNLNMNLSNNKNRQNLIYNNNMMNGKAMNNYMGQNYDIMPDEDDSEEVIYIYQPK
jgi:hypothetical protein